MSTTGTGGKRGVRQQMQSYQKAAGAPVSPALTLELLSSTASFPIHDSAAQQNTQTLTMSTTATGGMRGAGSVKLHQL